MSITSLSNQLISIENPTGRQNRHGQPGFGSAASARCRFERTYKTIITAERERDPVHAVVGLPASVTIVRGARVTYGTDVYRVIQLAEAVGASGAIHHREALLQEWSYSS